MLSVLNWIETHGVVIAVPAFTLASVALKAIADGFQILGKKAPSWVGSALTGLGSVLHLLNGGTG